MKMIQEALSDALMFKPLSEPQLASFSSFWDRREIEPGEVLWEQGTPANEMALLSSGRLAVRVDGAHITNIRVGEVLGETGVFVPDATRTATVYALERSVLLTLTDASLSRLRTAEPDVYALLVGEALKAMTKRIRVVSKELRRTMTGTAGEAPTRTEPSVLARMWKAIKPGPSAKDAPPILDVLKGLPVLSDAPSEVLITVSKAFKARSLEAGAVVFLEDEPGAECYVVATAKIDLLREVRAKTAERLARLVPGDIFGIHSLIDGGARSSSAVVAEAGWVYAMSDKAMAGLEGDARLYWFECLLSSVRAQLTSANQLLSDVRAADLAEMLAINPKMTEARLQKLLKASGFLEGGTLY